MNPPADARVARAWALKEACYEAWSRDPTQAAAAARELAELRCDDLPAREAALVRGLGRWTAGIADVTQGQMAEAVAAFDDAQRALGEAGEADAAAQTQVPKIMALSMLGQHEAAAACAQAAQQALRALGNLAAAGRVSLNLGGLLLRRDAYAQAARHYREAAVLFARRSDHQHSVLADLGLAAALSSMGDFDEALRIYARARVRAQRHDLRQSLAMIDESVALVQLARGQYDTALQGMESARRGFEALGLPHWTAVAEKQLADTYLELRLLPEALALFDAAIQRFRTLALPEDEAFALAQRGRALALRGRREASRDSFQAAAERFAVQAHEVGQASVQLALAELALAQGDAAGALQQAQAAAAALARSGHAEGATRAAVLRAEALAAAAPPDGPEASAARSVARGAYEAALADARLRGQLPAQVRCLSGLGLLTWAESRAGEAAAAFEAAIDLLEDQRRALPGDEFRSAFLTDQLLPYRARLRLALADGDAADVLTQLERYRARSLADRLAGADTPLADADPALRERVNWLARRVRRLQEDGEPSAALEADLRAAEHQLLESARRARLAGGAAAASAADARFDPAALQAGLAPGEALVEYGALDGELFAVVVRADRLVLQRALATEADVVRSVQSARLQLDAQQQADVRLAAHQAQIAGRMQQRLRQLHQQLWAPLAASLAGATQVLIVPHGPLASLPFAALPADARPGDAQPGDAPEALGHRLVLAQAASAQAALHGLRHAHRVPRHAVVIGESSALPWADAEARTVAACYPSADLLVGAAASCAALEAAAPAADVLHLACHAQFRADSPRFSALHLADGPMTVERAERLPLAAGLVVLSACDTALADEAAGDEQVGLVRAFLVAGAARVLAALWPVRDDVTAAFMAHFHAALQCGQTAGEALRAAQVALARSHPQPCHWAAFTLFGGW
ncbi:CHAT domain-containing protein [Aquabacterium sp.]|uniref:CHAT domain-containing protein n=1 Tax=Aquabacterium sp. TaxID=1872578 RepID=UPI0037853108